ncbi:MAG: transposase [Candidatus Micrarchaeota archaeon]
MNPRRKYTREFKLAVVNQLDAGKSTAQIVREHNIHPSLPSRWRKEARTYPETAFSGNGKAYTYEAQLAEKDRLIGKLYAELELLKKVTASLRRMAEEQKERSGP